MADLPAFEFPPYRLSGTVYGTLLNDPQALAALGATVHQAPYKAPPKAPVLYVKPRNTLAESGDALVLPSGWQALSVGANLGLVLGRTASRVPAERAMDFIAGYVIVNDVSLPHQNFYRPSIRFIARDGFCPIGKFVKHAGSNMNPDALAVRVYVDDKLVQSTSTAGRVRPTAVLLSDVSDFMTLNAGDVLMLGAAAGPPQVRAGERVAIEIEGLGVLENRVVSEGSV